MGIGTGVGLRHTLGLPSGQVEISTLIRRRIDVKNVLKNVRIFRRRNLDIDSTSKMPAVHQTYHNLYSIKPDEP